MLPYHHAAPFDLHPADQRIKMMHLTLVEHEARHFHDPGTHCTSVRSDSGSWDNRFILIPNASQGPVAEPVEVSASLNEIPHKTISDPQINWPR